MIIKAKNNNFKAGFTLLEMMVVLIIIAILAAVTWGNFFSSLVKGRDSRRKQDLEMVVKALDVYYNDNRSYPLTAKFPAWGQPLPHPTPALAVSYMTKLPEDPSSPGFVYCYESSDGSYFKLYAHLENANDPKKLPADVLCNGVNYNYGISSANTTP